MFLVSRSPTLPSAPPKCLPLRVALIRWKGVLYYCGANGDGDLSRPALIQTIARGEEAWEAVTSIGEAVMLAKEEAEHVRVRQFSSSRPSYRSRRPGRRGSRGDLQPLSTRACGRWAISSLPSDSSTCEHNLPEPDRTDCLPWLQESSNEVPRHWKGATVRLSVRVCNYFPLHPELEGWFDELKV